MDAKSYRDNLNLSFSDDKKDLKYLLYACRLPVHYDGVV